MNKEKIVITGSDGLIGSNLISKLNNDTEYICTKIDKKRNLDITDFNSLTNIKGNFDTLIHCAAAFSDDSDEGFDNNIRINTLGTYNICQFLKLKNINNFIYISSIFAFDEEENQYFNSYGLTKKHGEEIAKMYCNLNGISLTILRFSQIYDSYGLAKSTQPFLYNLVDNIRNKQKIILYGEKDPIRNFIHIEDVIDVIYSCISNKILGEFNCVNRQGLKITEIIQIINEIFNYSIEYSFLREKQNIKTIFIPTDKLWDNEKFISFQDGIKRYIGYINEEN
ncbi:MAG: NAD-dependent epimerase/dehydratase family protein [Candidatus Thorarchaeota archaeon]